MIAATVTIWLMGARRWSLGDDVPVGVDLAFKALEIRSSNFFVLARIARCALIGISNQHRLVACVQHEVVCSEILVFGA